MRPGQIDEWDEPTLVLEPVTAPAIEEAETRYYIGEDEVERATWETAERNAQWLREAGLFDFEVCEVTR